MLPPLTVPAGLLEVLQVARRAFTVPGFSTFTALVTGYLGATGRRTITGMWIAAGLAGRAHHGRAHRFFSHAKWCPDAVGLLLARAVVAAFIPAGTTVRFRPPRSRPRATTSASCVAAMVGSAETPLVCRS